MVLELRVRPLLFFLLFFCSVVEPKCTQLTRFCESADKGTQAKARSAGHKQFRSFSSTRLRPRVTPIHPFPPISHSSILCIYSFYSLTIHPFLPSFLNKAHLFFSLFSFFGGFVPFYLFYFFKGSLFVQFFFFSFFFFFLNLVLFLFSSQLLHLIIGHIKAIFDLPLFLSHFFPL